MLNKKDRLLLEGLQDGFPLNSRPYAQIAARIGMSEKALIRKLKKLKKDKVIRYVGAIFDNRALGVKSTLVAMAVPKNSRPGVTEIVNSFSQVSHNYLRDDEFNLWFTLSAADKAGLQKLLIQIKKKTGIKKCLGLDTIKVFKIDARFDLKTGSRPAVKDPGRCQRRNCTVPAADDIKYISGLNKPMEITEQPFVTLADNLGLSEKRILSLLAGYRRKGWLRRIGVILDHFSAGLKANALVVWKVPENRIADAVRLFSAFPGISHCYQRRVLAGWTYNIYTMLHAADKKSADSLVKFISDRVGIKQYRVLFTLKELKKEKTDLEKIFNLY
jgi:DNA-binding Lrp family transcriptional regulator